jgi:hypothetical protein
VEIARYLRDHTGPDDRIAVFGSEPQIYFYADRRSATGYVYTYGLMEPQKYALTMQQEMAREIEQAHPKYLVFVTVPTSWLRAQDSQDYIFQWFKEYTQGMELDGLVELAGPDQIVYKWGDEARAYRPTSPFCVYLLRSGPGAAPDAQP